MTRPLRIEFPNAIYHVMARANGRQAISKTQKLELDMIKELLHKQ